MSFEEMIVAVVGAVGAFALVGFLAAKTFGLIKAWINRNSSGVPEEQFNRLARAFMEYKKDTQRRLQHLETIITEEDSVEGARESEAQNKIEAPRESIELDDTDEVSKEESSSNKNNLRNMLRE